MGEETLSPALQFHGSNRDINRVTNTADQVVRALEVVLTKEQDPSKAPHNFDAALSEVCECSSSRPRDLLNAGFRVWFAYFLAVKDNPEIESVVANLTSQDLCHRTVLERGAGFLTLLVSNICKIRTASDRTSAHE
ncbi:hypothetical protein F4821DRAFT_248552 [Hypoxylon rubiginosum]|uniref:Uncharacterized protein n=1 Tax=Hypoxylon rubiginosum TaxID=110542 RepID=A0ACC0CMZ4_9PEZI|nr:hypothetical protein F4821DRAFT_248552 [Hypoxylon rubiginosum]